MAKKRVLSGIQPSGRLHIGNYFGMIRRMVDYQDKSDLFCFIANLHSMTTVSDAKQLRALTLDAATDLLALGIDPDKSTFWAQSDVPEVCELAWILSCLAPMGLMERAHSYKDKVAKGLHPTLGLFSYPILMTADILLPQSQIVPVGKDQKQHVEIARDIAEKFNHHYGETFTLPEPEIPDEVAVIPGTDGQKMSKSYNNTIPIFATESEWKKAVMGIVSDSKSVADKKEPSADTTFQLYKLFASPAELKALDSRYKKGGMGYGEAKKMLLEKVSQTFSPFVTKRNDLTAHPEKVEAILARGAEKVRRVTQKTLDQVRQVTGLKY